MRRLWLRGIYGGVLAAGVCLGPVLTFTLRSAQAAPPTQPAALPTSRPGAATTAPSTFPPFGRGLLPEERAALDDFLRDHMKYLRQVLEDQPRGPRRRPLMFFAIMRFRQYEQAANDPVLQEKILKSIESEDQLFQYVLQFQDAPSPEQETAIRGKVREKMEQIVDSLLSERAQRIQNLKAKLDAEDRKLQEDLKNRDRLVDRRVEVFEKQFLPEVPATRQSTQTGDRSPAPGNFEASETPAEKPR